MPAASPPAGLPSQTHKAGGARALSRFRGAVRRVVAGSIALTGRLRRPAAPKPRHTAPAPREMSAPSSPRRRPALRRSRAAAPVPQPAPARPGWLARWFGPHRRSSAPPARPPFADSNDTPFTPESCPGLSPEVCRLLNTPVEDCNPEDLRLVLAVFARHLAETVPPALGLDAEALFSTFGAGSAHRAKSLRRMPRRPKCRPRPRPHSTKPNRTQHPRGGVTAASAVTNRRGEGRIKESAPADMRGTMPHAASPIAPVLRRSRSIVAHSRPFRHCRRARSHRRSPDGPRHLPPGRRLSYATRAGPS